MKMRKLLPVINFLTVILMIAVNALAVILPLNNLTTGQISDSYPVLFTPAGYVFSIWSIIYLGLTAFAIYQVLPAQRDNPRLARIGVWFTVSNLLNAAWIFAWQYLQVPLSIVIMLALLGSLLVIYQRLQIGTSAVSTVQKWLVNVPFSIYLGWISVATIANASVLLYKLGWDGFGLAAPVWTAIVLLVGAALGIAMIILRSEVAYPLVIVWAFVGVWIKNGQSGTVALTAILCAAAVTLVLVGWRVLRAGRPLVKAGA
jgi:translocator protein